MQSDPPVPAEVSVPRTSIRRRLVRVVLAAIVLSALSLPLLLAISSAREAARMNSCNCRGKQFGIALNNYHDANGGFPPAYIADQDGKPMHSWRVLILPLLEEHDLYNAYRFDEPWDGPHNRQLADKMPGVYRCPSADGDRYETSYVAVVGPDTMWPGAKKTTIHDIRDGTSKTIAIVEVAHSGIHWMEPRDLTMDEALSGINSSANGGCISSNHPGGANVIWGDAHVSFLPNDLPMEQLKGLLTANGGEPGGDPTRWP